MSKIVAAGVMALFIGTVPAAYAQAPSAPAPGAQSATDAAGFTDVRIAVIKAALQLTPDQEKLWPPVEDAIRNRAKNREARIAAIAKRVEELHDRGAIEALRDRDPVAFLQRRAEALAQRSADLSKLASAWEPLYKTLSPDQKRRMAFLTIYVVRQIRDAAEERRSYSDDDED
jgi:4'-phosphopantetheinyl transferase EntD